jgi:SprT protein
MNMHTLIRDSFDKLWTRMIEVYPQMSCTTKPTIRMDLNGTSAGQIKFMIDRQRDVTYDEVLRFNVPMFELNYETQPHIVDDTVGHELCHFISMILHGYSRGKNHGYNWQNVMIQMGFSPDRTHNHQLANNVKRQERFEYHCDCQTHMVAKRTHNRMLRGQTRHCRGCKGELRRGTTSIKPPTAVMKPAPVQQAKARAVRTTGGSKADIALQIVSQHFSEGRGACIQLIMTQCNMTKAGASTYYQNAKKKLQG